MQIADRDPTGATRMPRWAYALACTFATLAACASQGASSASAEPCPNEALRTGPSAHLPDCRAYEQVTPPSKNTGEVIPTGAGEGPGGLTTEGVSETMTFTSLAGFAGSEGAEGLPGNTYAAVRGPGGWETSSLTPSATRFVDLEAGKITGTLGGSAGHSADRRGTLWVLHELGQPLNQAGLYLTGPGSSSSPQELGPAVPPGAAPVLHGAKADHPPIGFKVEGLSADASRVVFKMGQAGSEWQQLASRGVGGPEALLEYAGSGNSEPLPLGVDDEGKPVDGCGSQILGGQLHSEAVVGSNEWTHNAISSDGKTIFLTDTCHYGIYARVDNGEAGAETVAVSEPSREDCAECITSKPEPAYFAGASRDGSKVFFTTGQELLPGAKGENLYEFDFDAPAGRRVVRITSGDATVSNPEVNLQGIVQISEDGSHVYFVATGVLTKNPNIYGQQAAVGLDNLYVVDSETGTMSFIASLAANDAELWGAGAAVGRRFPVGADVTPDGDFLVFASHADLTPGDTSTAAQIFEYDAQTGSLVRVSVGEDGYNGDGNTHLGPQAPELDTDLRDPNDAGLPEAVGAYNGSYSASTYLDGLVVSADGSDVFFTSSDGLTPQALNDVRIHGVESREVEGGPGSISDLGPLYAENVYEYRAGNVYLISDGRDLSAGFFTSAVRLLGTDPSGRDVFFTSADQLVPQDTDSNLDIYDARVDGGFPAPAPPAECQGNTCGGAAAAGPPSLSPGSEFQTGGNPLLAPAPYVAPPKPRIKAKPKKCKPGTKRKHGKCQKAKARKSSRDRRAK